MRHTQNLAYVMPALDTPAKNCRRGKNAKGVIMRARLSMLPPAGTGVFFERTDGDAGRLPRSQPMGRTESKGLTGKRARTSAATSKTLARTRWTFGALVAICMCLVLGTAARADTLTGTVTDPSGAVVAGARIEISGGSLSQPLELTTDATGRFSAPNLAAGKYSVKVSKEGFDDQVSAVDLNGTADLTFTLTIATQQTSVNVTGKAAAYLNSDPLYRQLRDLRLGTTYKCENFTLKMDVGTFELKLGTLTLLGLVNRFETGAIFIGRGHFTLKPVLRIEAQELKRRAGLDTAEEDFGDVVFRFSGSVYPQFTRSGVKPRTLERGYKPAKAGSFVFECSS